MQKIGSSPYKKDPVVLGDIEEMAKTERNKKVKAAAISYLVKIGDAKYLPVYQAAVSDSSYSVAGAAFKGLADLDTANAYSLAKKYSVDAKGELANAINKILFEKGTEADFDFISESFKNYPLSQEKLTVTAKYLEYLQKVSDIGKIKKGIDLVIKFRNIIPEPYRPYVDPTFKEGFEKLSAAKGKEVEEYIISVFK
jgi:aminopeptidase N